MLECWCKGAPGIQRCIIKKECNIKFHWQLNIDICEERFLRFVQKLVIFILMIQTLRPKTIKLYLPVNVMSVINDQQDAWPVWVLDRLKRSMMISYLQSLDTSEVQDNQASTMLVAFTACKRVHLAAKAIMLSAGGGFGARHFVT